MGLFGDWLKIILLKNSEDLEYEAKKVPKPEGIVLERKRVLDETKTDLSILNYFKDFFLCECFKDYH